MFYRIILGNWVSGAISDVREAERQAIVFGGIVTEREWVDQEAGVERTIRDWNPNI